MDCSVIHLVFEVFCLIFLQVLSILLSYYSLSAVWGGAKLADVLELVGIPKLTSTTKFGGKHVEFVSIDKCKVMLSMACKLVQKKKLLFLVMYIFMFSFAFSCKSKKNIGGKWRPLQGVHSAWSGHKSCSRCSTCL